MGTAYTFAGGKRIWRIMAGCVDWLRAPGYRLPLLAGPFPQLGMVAQLTLAPLPSGTVPASRDEQGHHGKGDEGNGHRDNN